VSADPGALAHTSTAVGAAADHEYTIGGVT